MRSAAQHAYQQLFPTSYKASSPFDPIEQSTYLGQVHREQLTENSVDAVVPPRVGVVASASANQPGNGTDRRCCMLVAHSVFYKFIPYFPREDTWILAFELLDPVLDFWRRDARFRTTYDAGSDRPRLLRKIINFTIVIVYACFEVNQ